MFVKINVRDIILFHFHLKHGVWEVSTCIERISLAFNTVFIGATWRERFSNLLLITGNH